MEKRHGQFIVNSEVKVHLPPFQIRTCLILNDLACYHFINEIEARFNVSAAILAPDHDAVQRRQDLLTFSLF
jgi:hypothetical protein